MPTIYHVLYFHPVYPTRFTILRSFCLCGLWGPTSAKSSADPLGSEPRSPKWQATLHRVCYFGCFLLLWLFKPKGT